MQQPGRAPRSSWRRVRGIVLFALSGTMVLLAGACTGLSGASGDQANGPGATPSPQAELTVAPSDGTAGVRPTKPVKVTVSNGKVRDVTVSAEPESVEDEEGERPDDDVLDVGGTSARSGSRWQSSEPLLPDAKYTVEATAVDDNGLTASVQTSFTTVESDGALRAGIAPLDGETVGVGMPIVVYLRNPVADEFKDDVERRLDVDMSEPVEGAWHWMDDETVHFRPRQYWPEGEHVELTTNLVGVPAGDGVWGDQQRTVEFDVGERHVSVVDVEEHSMEVRAGGEEVKTVPVSAGKPDNPSSNGTHVALEKLGSMTMDSSSYGVPVDSPEGYSVETDWNVRITWSGQFVHSAPWSLGAQGERNVSHGCVNMSPKQAEWFYEFTQRGDVIKVQGSSRDVEPRNGWTDWNVSWDEWVAGSALNRSVNSST